MKISYQPQKRGIKISPDSKPTSRWDNKERIGRKKSPFLKVPQSEKADQEKTDQEKTDLEKVIRKRPGRGNVGRKNSGLGKAGRKGVGGRGGRKNARLPDDPGKGDTP